VHATSEKQEQAGQYDTVQPQKGNGTTAHG
jgi:hypothetical protein